METVSYFSPCTPTTVEPLRGLTDVSCTLDSLDTHLCYAAWRSSYSSRASIGV